MNADSLTGFAMLSALAALVFPWGTLASLVARRTDLLTGLRIAAASAAILAAVGTIAFSISFLFARHSDIPIDLIINPPLLLFAWLRCVFLAERSLRESPTDDITFAKLQTVLTVAKYALAVVPVLFLVFVFRPISETNQQATIEVPKPATIEPPKPAPIEPCEKRAVRAFPPGQAPTSQISLVAVVPALYFPQNGATFTCYPRMITLEWDPVPGATEYLVELEFFDSNAGRWLDIRFGSPRIPVNYRDIDFPGAQPGRWRVTAFNANSRSQPSAWSQFVFQH